MVIGDAYAGEGFELTHTCYFRELLDGCFHDSIAVEFGPGVLQELLAEVRATAGLPEEASDEVPDEASDEVPEEASDEVPDVAPSPPPGRVDVALTGCKSVDLPLAVALRSITRAPIKKLLSRLTELPQVLAADVAVADARAMEKRLTELGARVELRSSGVGQR